MLFSHFGPVSDVGSTLDRSEAELRLWVVVARARSDGLSLDHTVGQVIERTRQRYAQFLADPDLVAKFEALSFDGGQRRGHPAFSRPVGANHRVGFPYWIGRECGRLLAGRREVAVDLDLGFMTVDLGLVVAGLVVGFVVGLTGMGGGALMTPILILFFDIDPLAAVSSDLVVSLMMKPVGAAVHLRRGTVNMRLVKWLMIGSVPAAFGGVLILKAIGDGDAVQHAVKVALGIALLVSVATMLGKATISLRQYYRDRDQGILGRAGTPCWGSPSSHFPPCSSASSAESWSA